jgi:hypothetical protein
MFAPKDPDVDACEDVKDDIGWFSVRTSRRKKNLTWIHYDISPIGIHLEL